MLDDIDRAILRTLQDNARTSNAQIARDLGLAPSAILERIRKLEDRGVITGYSAVVNPAALGYDLTAFVLIRTTWAVSDDVGAAIAAVPEVQEVHHIAGEDCYIAKLRTTSTVALGELLQSNLGGIVGISNSRTLVVLGSVKDSFTIAIPEAAPETRRVPPISRIG